MRKPLSEWSDVSNGMRILGCAIGRSAGGVNRLRRMKEDEKENKKNRETREEPNACVILKGRRKDSARRRLKQKIARAECITWQGPEKLSRRNEKQKEINQVRGGERQIAICQSEGP